MRIRPLIGGALSLGILAVTGFLIFVGLTTSVNTLPMLLIPSLLGLAIGLFLCIRVPDNNIGLVVLVAVQSLSVLNAYELVQDWGVVNGHPILAMIASMSGTFAFGAALTSLVLLSIWFPDGVAINRWSGWVARTAIILISASLFAVFSAQVCVVAADTGNDCSLYVTNPWGISGFDGSLIEVLYVGLYLLAIPSVVAVVLRWRRSSGVERAQLKWFGLSAGVFIVGVFLVTIVGFLFTIINQSLIGPDLAAWAFALTLSGVWVSIGFAVAKYRLYDIDRVISRGLGYVLVVGILGLIYAFGAVWLPTRLVGEQHPMFVAGSTLAIAGLFKPVRSRALRWIDSRFYRAHYDADAIATRFSATLRAELDLDQLSEGLTSVAVETLHPASASIWIRGR